MSANSLGRRTLERSLKNLYKRDEHLHILAAKAVQQWNAGNGSKINNFLIPIITAIWLLGWIVVLTVKLWGKSFFESEIEWNAWDCLLNIKDKTRN